MLKISNVSITKEISRKVIHLFILLIPFIYFKFGKINSFYIFLSILIIALIGEFSKRKSKKINNLIISIFKPILRENEINNKNLSGLTWLLIGAPFVCIISNNHVFFLSYFILAICDSFASIIGKKFISKPFLDKSLSGFIAFYLSGIIVLILYMYYNSLNNEAIFFIFAIIALLSSALSEAKSKTLKLDDNLLIPLTFAVEMTFFDIIWSFI